MEQNYRNNFTVRKTNASKRSLTLLCFRYGNGCLGYAAKRLCCCDALLFGKRNSVYKSKESRPQIEAFFHLRKKGVLQEIKHEASLYPYSSRSNYGAI
jgi:hypothetical protein